jgi:hypothetical protein
MSEQRKALSVKELAERIAAKIDHTAARGKLMQRRTVSPKSPSLCVVLTPSHDVENKEGEVKTVPTLYHTEFKAPLGGAIVSVRTERDLQKLIYLREHPAIMDGLIDLGRASLTLNVIPAEDDAEVSDDDQWM